MSSVSRFPHLTNLDAWCVPEPRCPIPRARRSSAVVSSSERGLFTRGRRKVSREAKMFSPSCFADCLAFWDHSFRRQGVCPSPDAYTRLHLFNPPPLPSAAGILSDILSCARNRIQDQQLTKLLTLAQRKAEVEAQIIRHTQELADAYTAIRKEFEAVLKGRSEDVEEASAALDKLDKEATQGQEK